jgi:hypothetical protein
MVLPSLSVPKCPEIELFTDSKGIVLKLHIRYLPESKTSFYAWLVKLAKKIVDSSIWKYPENSLTFSLGARNKSRE